MSKGKRDYGVPLTAVVNDLGVLDMDTVKGCRCGLEANPDGCYGTCYAKKIADFRGIDFSKSVTRKIYSQTNLNSLIHVVKYSQQKFIRIGTMGDPSHDWEYTIRVCSSFYEFKPIVIITKHWIKATDSQKKQLGSMGVIINTSISPLDTEAQIDYRMKQYADYKQYGLSVLRIVSCKFNEATETGQKLAARQRELFKNENTIDKPLQVTSKYPLVVQGLILVEKDGGSLYISKSDPNMYMGDCYTCPTLCGLCYRKG